MFHSARIKLTAWYLVIIMCVSTFFSLALYRISSFEINRFEERQRERIERQIEEGVLMPPDYFPPPRRLILPDLSLLEETKRRIALTLVLINGAILVLSGAFGYLLAGRTLSPIARMLEEQKRFISDASHELKTPLTSLKLAFEVFLKEKKTSEKQTAQLVKESIGEIDRLSNLTNSLLTIASHQDQKSLPREWLNMTDIVNRAVKIMTYQAKERQIRIDSRALPGKIFGNRGALTELLTILLDNAVKYSPAGSTVIVKSAVSGRFVKITVTDCGPGIAAGDLPHIFDRFYRSDDARVRESASGGFGLGLSIAKQIATGHNAEITVKSKTGKGTEFTVRIAGKK